ncbi:MAG: tRNA lysidine(34) synthetase TilS, partial [Heliobacteriaceae bacterium]|nr:tRNA lysidine(34) synthetase TilS [Heliobacteriaceae bacterium]
SLNDEQNCRGYAQACGVEFYCETLSPDAPQTETAGRQARYEFLERAAKKFNSKAVLTAHNYDDNAETVLYRIIKGTGIKGLEGIPEQRGIFYRPLLGVTRAQIEEYCRTNGLKPNNDASNDNTRYKRNLIRHKILPLMREINADVVKSLNSLSQVAAFDNRLLDEYLETLDEPFKNFHNCSDALKSRLIYRIFAENNIDCDRTRVNIILNFIEENKHAKPAKTVSVTKGLWISAGARGIEVISEHPLHCLHSPQ